MPERTSIVRRAELNRANISTPPPLRIYSGGVGACFVRWCEFMPGSHGCENISDTIPSNLAEVV